MWFKHEGVQKILSDGITNNIDPDQTAPSPKT